MLYCALSFFKNDAIIVFFLGLKPDLFQHLFVRPTPLQEALAHPPGARSRDHIKIIVSTLRLIPFYSSMTQSLIEDLASIIGIVHVICPMSNAQILWIANYYYDSQSFELSLQKVLCTNKALESSAFAPYSKEK